MSVAHLWSKKKELEESGLSWAIRIRQTVLRICTQQFSSKLWGLQSWSCRNSRRVFQVVFKSDKLRHQDTFYGKSWLCCWEQAWWRATFDWSDWVFQSSWAAFGDLPCIALVSKSVNNRSLQISFSYCLMKNHDRTRRESSLATATDSVLGANAAQIRARR